MDKLFKQKSFLDLIGELNDIHSFYANPYGEPDIFGHVSYPMPRLYEHRIKFFLLDLEKLKLTTSEKNISRYIALRCEVRHKLLSIISVITNVDHAREVFLKNYKIYLEHCDALTEYHPEAIFDIVVDPKTDESEMISKHDQFEDWLSGKPISFVLINERTLNSICKYFNTDRRYIHSNCKYQGYGDSNYLRNIDFNRLGNTLVNENWINSDQHKTFNVLFSGKAHYEPLKWNGGLSDFNKFIQAMYLIGIKESKSPNIEWTNFSSFTLVNNEFPYPKNLKGAFTPTDKSIKALTPFGNIVNDILL
ncbi:MAG: hypothetical protein IPF70_19000 [Saprospiraceae bacterium]|nr:hypothetical protein [Saprospiraceae bacterium]